MVKSSLAPKLEIAGKRKFRTVSNLITLDVLYNQFVKGVVGITAGQNLVPIRSFLKNSNSQHTYFIYLGTDSMRQANLRKTNCECNDNEMSTVVKSF